MSDLENSDLLENENETPWELETTPGDELKHKKTTLTQRFSGVSLLVSFLAMVGCTDKLEQNVAVLKDSIDNMKGAVEKVLADRKELIMRDDRIKKLESDLFLCTQQNTDLKSNKEREKKKEEERIEKEAKEKAIKDKIQGLLDKEFGTDTNRTLVKQYLNEIIFQIINGDFYGFHNIAGLDKPSDATKLVPTGQVEFYLDKVLSIINSLSTNEKVDIVKEAMSYLSSMDKALDLYSKYEKILSHHPDYFNSKAEGFKDWKDECDGGAALHDDYEQNVEMNVKQGILAIKHIKTAFGFSLDQVRTLVNKAKKAFGVER